MHKKHRIRFSKQFVAQLVFYFGAVLLLAVVFVLATLHPTSPYVFVAYVLMYGIIILPIATMLAFAIILLVFGALYVAYIKIMLASGHKIDDPTLVQVRELQALGFEQFRTSAPIQSIALNGYSANQDPVKFTYSKDIGPALVQVYIYENFSIIRYGSKSPYSIPSFVINSSLNDNSRGAIESSLYHMTNFDAGSDFGKYIRLGIIKGTETDVLQVMDPSLMITWLGKGLLFDTVVTSSYVDFRYEFRSRTKLNVLVDNATDLGSKLTNKSQKTSHNLIASLFTLKHHATPVTTMLDIFTLSLVKSAGILIVSIFAIGLTSSSAPLSLSIVVAVALTIAFAWTIGRMIVIINVFALYIFSKLILTIFINCKVFRLKSQYVSAIGKYD